MTVSQRTPLTVSDPLVTVIILNWNGGEEVIGCIEHVIAQSYGPIEVIVIDNASVDISEEAIRLRFPDIGLVANRTNVGFSSGMNQGIEAASGEYVLLLGQDVWIRDDFVQNAVQLLADGAQLDIGMIAARVYKLDGGRKTDELVGGAMLLRKRFRLVGDPDLSAQHYTLGPSFCCPFLSKKMLSNIKACSGHCFDDLYFAYGEDMDLMLRAQLLGWRCLFSPNLVAWHTQSGSLGGHFRLVEKPPVFRKYSLRNRYLTFIKDVPFRLIVYLVPYMVLTEIALWPYFLFKSPSTVRCLVHAYVEAIQALPEALRLRRKIQANKKVSAKYLQQFFASF